MKTIAELAQLISGTVVGNANLSIEGITNLEQPKKGCVTFIQDAKYLAKLEATEIACIIVPPAVTQSQKPLIQVKDPKAAWARLLREFYPAMTFPCTISNQASIASSAKLGKGVTVEPFAKIGDHVEIGDGAVIRSFAYVSEKVKIGARTVLHPGVMIYENCEIGADVVLHAQSVIGADGFGYVAGASGQLKVPQVGNVIIEDQVEIGAGTTIDRATVGSTRIGKGCKIDNLVQIGHNVTIGQHTVISAQSGISGSTKIGSFVTMGGKAGIGDHVEIGDMVMVGAGSGVPSGKKIPSKQIVFGAPARPYQEARKQIGAQLRSAEMYEDIKLLRERMNQLEKQLSENKS